MLRCWPHCRFSGSEACTGNIFACALAAFLLMLSSTRNVGVGISLSR